MLSSYPPRECGIATFGADLARAISTYTRHNVSLIAIDEPDAARVYPAEVQWRLRQQDPASYREVATALGRSNIGLVNVQHEYGLFGGEHGELLLDFLEHVQQPVVTTLHTVLPEPPAHMREVTRAICRLSSETVVLAQSAIPLLRDVYGVDVSRVSFVPHGIPSVKREPGARHAMKARLGYTGRTLLSTFGLINPDKGIEYVLQALPAVVARYPDLLLLVLGETHPVVRRHSGERYRESLQALVDDLGLHDHVQFVNRYMAMDELINYLLATDIYLMAYLNPHQIVSGTMAYAVGCGKAVVATPFRYAREMLAEGRGSIVPFRDPQALGSTLLELLDNPQERLAMELRAYTFSRMMEWPAVANNYARIFRRHSDALPAVSAVQSSIASQRS